jgi:hypothetical protein
MPRMTNRSRALLLALFAVAALTVGVAGASAGGEYLGKRVVVPVKCEPSEGAVGTQRTCVATVVDESGEPNPPTGTVAFAGATQSAPAECVLVEINANSSSCSALVTPGAAGSYKFNVIYSGDELHEVGATEVSLVVGAASSSPVSNGSLAWAAAPVSGPPATESGLPTIKLGSKPARKTHARLATFTFSSETAGASFQCRLGKAEYKPCTSPFKRKVGLGKNLFSVRVVNGSGVFGANPLEYSWKVLSKRK